MSKIKRFDVLHILERNGWKWLCYDADKLSSTDDYEQYACNILGAEYESTIVAIISCRPDHLQLDGHYGVLWLEAIYENERRGCLSYHDMKDMQTAIIHAEQNLLTIGMPFTKDYRFHGRNKANMVRRNEKLRRMYNLEELESEDK